jgi:hypothetical protein
MQENSLNDLFNLIKSLNKSERRYFTLFINSISSRETNTIHLFNAITGLQDFNEEKLFELHKGKQFIIDYQVTKNRLQNLILKALRNYYSELSIDTQLANWLMEVEILYYKSNVKLCHKIIIKAKKLAYKYEKYEKLRDLLRWENLLEPFKSPLHYKKELDAELDHVINIINKKYDYRLASRKMHDYYYETNIHPQKKDIDQLLNGILSIEPEDQISKYWFFNAWKNYFHKLGQKESELKYASKCIQIFIKSPWLINEYFTIYTSAILSYINNCIELGKFNEAKIHNDQFGKNLSCQAEIKQQRFLNIAMVSNFLFDLLIHIAIGDFEEACKLINTFEKLIKQHHIKLNNAQEILFLISKCNICFAIQNYHEALNCINKIVNAPGIAKAPYVYDLAKVLRMIILFEQKKYELLEYEISSTKKNLQKNEMVKKVEELFIKTFKNILNSDFNRKLLTKSFIELKRELLRLKISAVERSKFYFFDFLAYVESYLQQKKMSDIIRARSTFYTKP